MKKITTLLSVFLFTLALQAQQTVNFKIEYKPNTTYAQTITQSNKVDVSYGDGGEPMVNESATTMQNLVKTGKLTGDEMPLNMEMTMDKSAQGADQLNGSKFYGRVKKGNVMVFDSIQAPGMQPEMKNMLKGMMEKMLTQAFVAERKVKVGESFVQEIPMNIPLGPVTLDMKDVVTYKLNKVEGTKAYFSLNHVITMQTTTEGEEMKGSGVGNGEMVYDMASNFTVQNDSDVSMEMAFSAQGMDMSVKTKNVSKITTIVTPSK
jgi:hypothetical protein